MIYFATRKLILLGARELALFRVLKFLCSNRNDNKSVEIASGFQINWKGKKLFLINYKFNTDIFESFSRGSNLIYIDALGKKNSTFTMELEHIF